MCIGAKLIFTWFLLIYISFLLTPITFYHINSYEKDYTCVCTPVKVFWWLLITYLFESIVEKKRENFEDVQKNYYLLFQLQKEWLFTKRKGQAFQVKPPTDTTVTKNQKGFQNVNPNAANTVDFLHFHSCTVL